MIEIYSNDFLKILQDKNNKTIFKIELSYSNKVFINSLIKTNLIKGSIVTDDYKIIKFKALSIKSLNQYLAYKNYEKGLNKITINDAGLLISNLTDQLKYLILEESYTILGYNIENIIVINDNTFVFLGSELITEIKDDKILISYPFTLNDFYVSPELLKIKVIPSYVHYKTSYFSLACLVLYTLLSNNDFYNEYLKKELIYNNLINALNFHPIKHTKLYWLLSRCLVKEPENRSILFI